MKLLPDFKTKSVGYYFVLATTVISLVTFLMYLIFGIASTTFKVSIFLFFLFAFLSAAVAVFYEGVLTDVLVLVSGLLLTFGLGFLINNSVGDFTEMVTPVGMYGNTANMPMRIAIAVVSLIGIVLDIIASYKTRIKEN